LNFAFFLEVGSNAFDGDGGVSYKGKLIGITKIENKMIYFILFFVVEIKEWKIYQ
jgi:hypothetical protein